MSLLEFLKATLRDKNQNPSGREITVFVFVIITLISWIGEQFFEKHIPDWMFLSFISLIAAGLGFYTFEPAGNSKNTPSDNQKDSSKDDKNS